MDGKMVFFFIVKPPLEKKDKKTLFQFSKLLHTNTAMGYDCHWENYPPAYKFKWAKFKHW